MFTDVCAYTKSMFPFCVVFITYSRHLHVVCTCMCMCSVVVSSPRMHIQCTSLMYMCTSIVSLSVEYCYFSED